MAASVGSLGGELNPKARRAIRGAWLGFFVDMFDIYLPIVVLAPALIYFVSPEMSPAATAKWVVRSSPPRWWGVRWGP